MFEFQFLNDMVENVRDKLENMTIEDLKRERERLENEQQSIQESDKNKN